MGAFQVHKLLFGRLVHNLPQNQRKSKILVSGKTVKLNKWIQRIRASQSTGRACSVSLIMMRVTYGADNDSSASWGGDLTLTTFKDFNTEDTEKNFENGAPLQSSSE